MNFSRKSRINTGFVEGEKPKFEEKALENDASTQFRYEEGAPNESLRNALDDFRQRSKRNYHKRIKNDASEPRYTELENRSTI